MNFEIARYIIRYFSHLLSDEERKAIVHYSTSYKSNNSKNPQKSMSLKSALREKDCTTENPKVLQLLENGIENFELNTAQRILENNPDQIKLIICPILPERLGQNSARMDIVGGTSLLITWYCQKRRSSNSNL
jgi:hypothetical protein